jgi:hypothetical protein
MLEIRKLSPWEVLPLVRRAFRAFALPAAVLLCCVSFVSTAHGVTVTLGPSSPGDYRWLNVADQAYEAAYRSSYDYSQAKVEFDYSPSAGVFGGTLTATNLKPNFAYQLKLSGMPEDAPAANEHIGLAGRWWEETWSGTAWADGKNLQISKGDGSSPNPNDDTYNVLRVVPAATSPTHLLYRFTGYLLFDYFITNDAGGASLVTQQDSSFHVLYNTLQGEYTHGPNDGPLKSSTFDPDPASLAYLGTDYPETTRTIYGEWERLPPEGVFLAPGSYSAQLALTEESFHGEGGTYAGSWAGAMEGTVAFSVVPEPGTVALFAAGFAMLVLRSRRRRTM